MSWKEAQAAQYEHSDEEEYSDDEYEPISVANWGNQTVTDEGSTQIDIGWGSLIDPNVKVKAGGVGSGQLHRRGGNFKPLDEQSIINQRLGKPIPKALGGGKKKGGKRPNGPPPARRPPPSSSYSSPMRPPSSSVHRSRAPVAPGQGPWGSGELASTPFWEQSANSSVSGTNASKYATPAPAAAPQRRQPHPPQQHQQQQYQQQRQYQQYQQPAAAPAAPVAPARQPEPAKLATSSLLGSGASKYATSAPVQHQYQQHQQQPPPPPPQQQQQQQQQYQQQYQQPVQNPVQNPVQQQKQPSEVTHRFDLPCLNFNIEMAHGIHAKLSVYSDDDPVNVVDRFERDHNLIMSQEQKDRFAEKVGALLVQYRS